jgi:hypothetical protein
VVAYAYAALEPRSWADLREVLAAEMTS